MNLLKNDVSHRCACSAKLTGFPLGMSLCVVTKNVRN